MGSKSSLPDPALVPFADGKRTHLFSKKDLLKLAAQICQILNELHVYYFLYGSLAVELLTGKKLGVVNDIDIMISQTDFDRISETLIKSSLPLTVTEERVTIKLYHDCLFHPQTNKALRIELDSWERYLKPLDIALTDFQTIKIDSTTCHIIRPAALLKSYLWLRWTENPDDKKLQEKIKLLQQLTKREKV